MEILVWLALALLPLGALAAVAGAIAALVVGPRPLTAVLSALAPVFLIVWIGTTYQEGVRADETGTGGNIFVTAGWLVAAVGAGLGAAGLAVRYRRTSRAVK